MEVTQDRGSALRREAGLSLLEVMVLLVVMGIAASVTLPLFGSSETSKLSWAAAQVESDIVFAQAESFVHPDNPRVLVFNLASNSYHVALASSPAVPITHPVTKHAYTVAFGVDNFSNLDGVTIQSYSLNGDNVLGFGLYGQLDQSDDATITLAAGEQTVGVTIHASTGHIVQ